MKPIQYVLLGVIAAGVALYFGRLRSSFGDRFMVLGICAAATILILFPDVTSRMAVWVGVGRGVDLVIYLALLGLAFLHLINYSRMRHLRQQMTQMVREDAIRQAYFPEAPLGSNREEPTTSPAVD